MPFFVVVVVEVAAITPAVQKERVFLNNSIFENDELNFRWKLQKWALLLGMHFAVVIALYASL